MDYPETYRTLVDGHVHLLPPFDWAGFLDRAASNFDAAASQLGLGGEFAGCLILAEVSRGDAFQSLLNGSNRLGDWTIDSTAEPHAIRAHRGRRTVFVIAGLQVRCRGGLEILAWGTTTPINNGMSAGETLAQVRESGALPIVSWGFGKWWFKSAELRRMVRESKPGDFFFGDSQGRPTLFPRPGILKMAEQSGIWSLPGSDDFSPGPMIKAGSYGFAVDRLIDAKQPAISLKDAVRGLHAQPRVFGGRLPVRAFVANQLRLRLR